MKQIRGGICSGDLRFKIQIWLELKDFQENWCRGCRTPIFPKRLHYALHLYRLNEQ